jgi:hypothetical protein
MRTPLIVAAAFIFAAPALAQHEPRVGARTTSPDAMVAQMNPASPEEEISQLIAAAEAHPLGSQENPIRVAGPDGERAYLARLHCADGAAVRIGARHEAGIGPYGSVVGAYEVICAGGSSQIVFDMYQEEHQETRAPAGFTLAPR